MNIINLFVALTVLIITVYLVKVCFKNAKMRILVLIIGFLFTLGVLVFPLISGINFASRVTMTILYAFQTIGMNQDIDIVRNIQILDFYEWVYVGFICLMYLLIPLMTATFLLSLIDNFVAKVRLVFSKKVKMFVFSNINERCLEIASRVKSFDSMILFANYNRNKIDEAFLDKVSTMKGIKISSNVSDIKFKKSYRELYFYLFSSNMEENLDNAIKLIQKYRDSKIKVWIYLLSNDEVAGSILDSMDKGNVYLDIVNEPERITYQLLDSKPLYLNTVNNKISALIIGDDIMASQFIKAITWCGQIVDYKLSITMIGNNAEKLREKLFVQCPELLNNYDYKFINSDLYSEVVLKELSNLKDINYVVLASSSDEENILNAMFLRSFFERQDNVSYERKPIINVLVRNDLLNEQVKSTKNEKGNSYDLNSFGSVHDIYFNNFIIDSSLEELTKEVHLSYDKSEDSREEKIKRFYQKEYYIKSSRAMALHLKYKMYSVLKEKYSDDMNNNLELFSKALSDNKVFDKLVRNEHDRWMAYTRVNGYVFINDKDVKKYQSRLASHVHHMAKLHPCLTDFDKLEKIGKSVGKNDLHTLDGDIILNMVNIMKK